MNSRKILAAVFCIGVALLLVAAQQSGCSVIKGEAEYLDADIYYSLGLLGGAVPEGTQISVLCNGTDSFSNIVEGDQGSFGINILTTTGSCVFQDIAFPHPVATDTTLYLECSDVVGNPGGCTVYVDPGVYSYDYKSVLYAFKCMEADSCPSFCSWETYCPGARCWDCMNACEDILCP